MANSHRRRKINNRVTRKENKQLKARRSSAPRWLPLETYTDKDRDDKRHSDAVSAIKKLRVANKQITV